MGGWEARCASRGRGMGRLAAPEGQRGVDGSRRKFYRGVRHSQPWSSPAIRDRRHGGASHPYNYLSICPVM